MGRGGGGCGRCGASRHGKRRYVSNAPIGDCLECGTPICEKHAKAVPDKGAYICTKCFRAQVKAASG